MLDGKRILAVVPARGGSKGVPLKNLKQVAGVSLVGLVGDLLKELDWVDRKVVSTDNDEIATAAEKHNLSVPFRRPEELSGDRIGDLEVLVHALEEMEKIDRVQYDIIVMLQPTSPLRRAEHVIETVQTLIEKKCDSVWTVSPTDLKYHPLKQLTLSDGQMNLFDEDGRKIIARQQLKPIYHRNGVAYAMTRDCLLKQKTTLGSNSSAVVIEEPMVSIDTLDDFLKVEILLKERSHVTTN